MAEKQTQSTQQRPQVQEQGAEVEEAAGGKAQPERGIARRGEHAGAIERRVGSGWTLSPFSMMRRMMSDMDRLFEDFGLGGVSRELTPVVGLAPPGGVFVPELEVFERDDKFIVRADLPGIKKEDIHVSCDDQGLLIEGERRTSSEEKRKGYFHSERSYGSFSRRIPIPPGAEVQSCDASFDDGVLEIQIDLPKESRRQIAVKSRGGATEGQAQASGEEAKAKGQKEEDVRH